MPTASNLPFITIRRKSRFENRKRVGAKGVNWFAPVRLLWRARFACGTSLDACSDLHRYLLSRLRQTEFRLWNPVRCRYTPNRADSARPMPVSK
jgi:hypothetical protein